MSEQTPLRKRPAQLLIVDDHEMARAGLRAMLSGEATITIVGEAANGDAAVRLCRELQPDLILMDMRMPVMDGLAATRAIKAESPLTRILMVTMHEDPDYLVQALKAGVTGYLLKDASRREVLQAIRQVLRGEAFLNSEMLLQSFRRLTAQPTPPPLAERLTPRELEVLTLLTQGMTNRAIAAALIISPATAKIHVEHIIAKLGVADRTQAAVRAIELGLVPMLGSTQEPRRP